MIDTAEKRRSVAGISVGFGITPNASKDAEWRQQVAWNYSGIPVESVIPPVPSLAMIQTRTGINRRRLRSTIRASTARRNTTIRTAESRRDLVDS